MDIRTFLLTINGLLSSLISWSEWSPSSSPSLENLTLATSGLRALSMTNIVPSGSVQFALLCLQMRPGQQQQQIYQRDCSSTKESITNVADRHWFTWIPAGCQCSGLSSDLSICSRGLEDGTNKPRNEAGRHYAWESSAWSHWGSGRLISSETVH